MDTTKHLLRRIFISHSREDDAFGTQIVQDLREFLSNDEAVWYDASGGLNGGDTWWRKIIEELTSRDVFIVILSPAAIASAWVNAEIDLAWRQKLSKQNKHIIPLLYKECDIRADLDTLQVLSFLPSKTYKIAFNELLVSLGLQPIIEAQRTTSIPFDMGTIIIQQMEQAFTAQEWSMVIRKADYIVRRMPQAINTDIYRMQGLALLQQGEVQAALEILEAAMVLTDNSTSCLRLLSEYTPHLVMHEYWEAVLHCATEALRLAPNDPNWLSGHQQAQMMLQQKTPSPPISDKAKSQPSDAQTAQNPPETKSENKDPNDVSSINDLFETFFSGTAASGTPRSGGTQRGVDLRYELTITFEEAVFGCQKEIELLRWELCLTCQGSGARAGTLPVSCKACNGTGEIRRIQESIFGQFVNVTRCELCHGEGHNINKTSCEKCSGRGRIRNNRRVVVNIPAGVDDGINVRVTGEGEISAHSDKPGNLYVVLSVKQHPFFKRQGSDILYELPISYTQTALGREIEVPTIDGKSTMLKIPTGTQNGRSFRLKGMGVPVVHSSARGDQHVVVKIVTPTRLSSEMKQLFEELERMEQEQSEQDGKNMFRNLFEKTRDVFQ